MVKDLTQGAVPERRPQAGLGPLLYTPPQAAELLNISQRKLWGISAPRGPLAVVRIGNSVRYSPDDLDAYVAAQRRAGVPNE